MSPGFAQLVLHGLDIIVILGHHPAKVLEGLGPFEGVTMHQELMTKGKGAEATAASCCCPFATPIVHSFVQVCLE
jgi:hypothetical protein